MRGNAQFGDEIELLLLEVTNYLCNTLWGEGGMAKLYRAF